MRPCLFLGEEEEGTTFSSLSWPAIIAGVVADDGSANGGRVVVGLGKERAQQPWLLPLDQKDLRKRDVLPTMKRGIFLSLGFFTRTGYRRRRGYGHG